MDTRWKLMIFSTIRLTRAEKNESTMFVVKNYFEITENL